MENLAYLYVLAEEAALPQDNTRYTAMSNQDDRSNASHRSAQSNRSPEGRKTMLEGDRLQSTYPTFYL